MTKIALGLLNCPLCESNNVNVVLNRDEAVFTCGLTRLKNYEVSLCGNCGFVYQNSAYSSAYQDAIVDLYKNYAQSFQFEFPRQDIKTLESLDFILANVPMSSETRVLEIGSDRGDFLHLIQQKTGADILGLEPSIQPQAKVPTIIGNIFEKNIDSTFDLIVMKHTFEHLLNPKRVVESLKDYLRDGGMVYIEVPSLERVVEFYLEDFIPDHVSHFSRESLSRLFSDWQVVGWSDEHFLRVIYTKKADKKSVMPIDSSIEVKKLSLFFNQFQDKINLIKHQIIRFSAESHYIVFFGAGLYFRTLLGDISSSINLKQAFFIDDNLKGDVEPCFGMKRAEIHKLKHQPVLVIGCSNDFVSQQDMYKKANEYFDNLKFLFLYSGFIDKFL